MCCVFLPETGARCRKGRRDSGSNGPALPCISKSVKLCGVTILVLGYLQLLPCHSWHNNRCKWLVHTTCTQQCCDLSCMSVNVIRLPSIVQSSSPTCRLVSIFSGVSGLQGVKISVFPLTLLVIVTTVLPLPRSLCVCDRPRPTVWSFFMHRHDYGGHKKGFSDHMKATGYLGLLPVERDIKL